MNHFAGRVDALENPHVIATGNGHEVDEAALLSKMELYFSLDELDELVFGLGIEGKISGETVNKRGQNLIGYMRRRGRLGELVEGLERERPSVAW